MLSVESLITHYGRIEALHGVDVTVNEGEIVILVGANGAGKTTLLRCLSGVQPVSKGSVTFEGRDITRTKPHHRVTAGIAQSPEGRQIFNRLSVADNLRLGAYRRRDKHQVFQDMREVYGMFPILQERADLPAGSLSGGQQQMLAIGRALMARPRLLLLDEPSMGLAPIIVDQIMEAIAALKQEGITVFLVEQNAYAALNIADRGYVLETGKVIMEGPARDLMHDERVREAYLGL